MSLNGLDTVQVTQIYESTIAEAGGWFLLHYVTRDEVDVYRSGSGGSAEFKDIIEQYEEKSPLYGLLIYRRKRVLLKYVPEGTSRLLKARLTVHLQSVIERFPHDALLSLEAAAELTDTALSSSVSVLKTSGSIRSLNSLKKRPLTEIAEDASEILISNTQSSTPIETPSSESYDLLPLSATTEQFIDSEDKESTSTTKAIRGLGDDFANNSSVIQRPSTSIDISDFQRRPSLTLSDSARSTGAKSFPSMPTPSSDTYTYPYKPKVKLAPRPVEESRHSSPYARPTSSLPAGVQLQSRERTITSPVMHPPNSARVTNFPLSPTDRYTNGFVQPLASANSTTYDKRPISRGSAVTVPVNVRSNDEPTLTPEKKRLMKALQKRKQQQKARQLAREGKFDDDDMVEHKESQYANGSDNFIDLDSTRLASVKDPDKIYAVTQISELDQTSLVDYQVTTSRLSQLEEDANPSKPGTPPSSTIKVIPFLQDELYSSVGKESDTPQDPEFSTDGPTENGNNTGENLQHTKSILQFPDWSDTNKHDRAVPSQETVISTPTTPSEQDVVSAEHDHEIEPKIESYQPLVLNFPPESELSNMDLSIHNKPLLESPEISTVTRSKVDPQASIDLPVIKTHHEDDQLVQNDGEVPDPESPQALAETFEIVDYANDSSSRPDPTVEATQSAEHNTKDEIRGSPHRVALGAQEEEEEEHPEINQDFTPLRTFKDDTADMSASMPLSGQQDYMDLSPSRDGRNVDPEDSQTYIKNADAEMYSSLALQSDSADNQPRSPTITPVRNSASHSEALSLEDSLLDELHSATVQEATSLKLPKTPPMSFSPNFTRPVEARSDNASPVGGFRSSPPAIISLHSEGSQHSQQFLQSLDASPISPITNTISESPTRTITPEMSTSLSQSEEQDNPSPNLPSFSTSVPGSRQASLSLPPGELERPVSRKSAVSSLISQRIKAFEDKFSAPSSPQQAPTSAVKAQIVTLRKVSLNTPSSQQAHDSTHADRNVHASYPTPSPSPHNLAQKLGFTKTTKKENLPKDATIRDKATQDTISKLNKGVTDNSPTTSVSPERPAAHQEARGMRSIFSSKSRKKKANNDPPSSSLNREGRKSVDASARGNSVSPHSNSSESVERTRAPSSTESLTSEGEKKDSKKRAGLLKRLSSMGSSTHRSIAETMTVPVNEKVTVESQEPEPVRNWRSSVILGELNIQFPDTLLWKRKHIEIDSQGFVILAPSQAEKNSKAIMKRYHVSDFKMPYVPEPDREELPYSVNLDFLDGSTIQCACDSSGGQQRVYQALTAARAAFDTA